VDKGYSEVLVDTDGEHHGPELGELLRRRCDTLKDRNARRAKLRSIANQAAGVAGTARRSGSAAPTSAPSKNTGSDAAGNSGSAR